ncbi:MAG: Rpn family recombination-promoting nuclease/putative transposase [Acidobacteriota bacterium]|nr:Rpn family recombination-promoting nuclease/putative transposase [Acidobacteriota bacterium]
MTKRNIDPRIDCIFKAILGSRGREPLTTHFLNHVLKLPANKRIVDIEFLNPYNPCEFQGDKYSIIDIKVKDQTGNRYQIEIQIALHDDLIKRMLYTLAAMLKSQLKSGDQYHQLKPVTGIWLLGAKRFAAVHDPYLHFMFYDRERQLVLTEDLHLHLLQLPNAPEADKIMNDGDRWLHFFQNGRQFTAENVPEYLDTPEIREALMVMQGFTEHEKDYLLYESRLDALRLENFWEGAYEREKAKTERVENALTQERAAREAAEAERDLLRRKLEQAGIPLDSQAP